MITPQYSSTKRLYRGNQIIWYIAVLGEIMLILRLVLKFFGANPNKGFTHSIFSITDPLAAPFLNFFNISRVDSGVLEWTTVIAMLVYWLMGWAITRFIITGADTSASSETVNN